jgi:heptosyltransferase-2
MFPEKILVIRLSSIGDLIHCSAIPRHIKARFPKSELHWLVREDMQNLVDTSTHIQKIWSLSRKSGIQGLKEMIQTLKAQNFTHVYDAHNNLRSNIICLFLKPQHFIRRSKDRLKRFLLFWFKINLFEKPYRSVKTYVAPLSPWGITYDDQGPEMIPSPIALQKVKLMLSQNSKWVAIAPATAWPKKNWPLDHWKQLVQKLLKETSLNILILGGPEDTFCTELVIDQNRCLNLQGKLSLRESSAIIMYCETLIAADTGILHIAEAQGKNVIGILGPTPFGHPNRPQSIGLQTNLWCQPCSKDGRGICYNPTYQKCLKDISAQMVYDSFRKAKFT